MRVCVCVCVRACIRVVYVLPDSMHADGVCMLGCIGVCVVTHCCSDDSLCPHHRQVHHVAAGACDSAWPRRFRHAGVEVVASTSTPTHHKVNDAMDLVCDWFVSRVMVCMHGFTLWAILNHLHVAVYWVSPTFIWCLPCIDLELR